MNRGDLENIKNKLYDVQIPVEGDVWNTIEASMRRIRRRRVLYWSSTAAAAVAALLIAVILPQQKVETQVLAQLILETEQPKVFVESPVLEQVDVLEDVVVRQISGIKSADVVALEKEDTESCVIEEVVEPVSEVEVAAEGEVVADEQLQDVVKSAELTDIYDLPDLQQKERGRYLLAFNSGIIPGSNSSAIGGMIRASSASNGGISQSTSIEQISDTKYSLPLNLGVQVQFPVGKNVSLGAGVNYTMLASRYDCLVNKKKYRVKQVLHYVGIPVNVYGVVAERNKFRFYLNAGGTIEKGIRAVYDLSSYDKDIHSTAPIEGLQFSVNAGMGAEYSLGNTVGVYLEPNIAYYINSDVQGSIRTDQPIQVKAELGFRFRF